MANISKKTTIMEEKIKERVTVLMKELSISPYTLAKNSNIGERTMYNQLTGQSKIGIAAIVAILNKYTNVSAEWLMRGDGDMLKAGIAIGNNDSSQTSYQMLANNLENVSKQSSNCLNVDSETDSNKLIAELRETISRQQELINRLNREIDGLYERIDELKRASSIAAPRSVTAV